jgi:hypothetical protein
MKYFLMSGVYNIEDYPLKEIQVFQQRFEEQGEKSL